MEVWTILTRGKHPRERDCWMMEKVAEIIAWLAMIDAATATTNIGQYILPAPSS